MDLVPGLRRAFDILNGDFAGAKTCSDAALEVLAYGCGGDVRKAIGSLENCYYASETAIDEELARQLVQRSGMRYDRDGQSHYDLLSALQKSIRGSDPDAAVFYLARILAGGDLVSACRRISVCAAEDIGLAYPNAVIFTKSCIDIALQVGLPEARIPLADAVILLATSPKSNSGEAAIDAAMAAVEAGKGTMVPAHLRDQNRPGSEGGYQYPHAFPNHWVRQQYLPDDLAGKTFYTPGENKTERAADEYWQKIKK
jgi:putative ATPase